MLLLITQIASDRPCCTRAVDAIAEAQRHDADGTTALLIYPWLSVWAAHCVRSRNHDHHAYLTAVAASVALHAGLSDLATNLLADEPRPYFVPTFGVLHDRASVAQRRLSRAGWSPVHLVESDAGTPQLHVTVDDLDPWRDCHGRPAARDLPPPQREAWADLLLDAWDLISKHSPDRAAELSVAWTSVVPLADVSSGASVSATHGDAFGGFGASFTPDASQFAATVIHEFQHSKVNALNDLVPLYDDRDGPRYFAPWRRDPRPLSAIVQGLAAFTAVAELWNDFRSSPVLENAATRHVAVLRVQVEHALDEIDNAPGLTAAGLRFLKVMRLTVEKILEYSLPVGLDARARHELASARHAWRHTRHGYRSSRA